MRKFTIALYITLLILTAQVIITIITKLTTERDSEWRLEWVFQAQWFGLFSGFLFTVMIMMRPNVKSRMLASL